MNTLAPQEASQSPRYPHEGTISLIYHLTVLLVVIGALALAVDLDHQRTLRIQQLAYQKTESRFWKKEVANQEAEIDALKLCLRDIERVVSLPKAEQNEADALLIRQ